MDEEQAKQEMVGKLRETVNQLYLIRKDNPVLTDHERNALQFAHDTLKVILGAHIDELAKAAPAPKLEMAKRVPVPVPVVDSIFWRDKK